MAIELPENIKKQLKTPGIKRIRLPIIKVHQGYREKIVSCAIESPKIPSVKAYPVGKGKTINVDNNIADFETTKDVFEGNIYGGNLTIKDKRYTLFNNYEDFEPLSKRKFIKPSFWRGMSGEEWQDVLNTKFVCSKGEYNLGDDEIGTTYFSEDPTQALHYASGFAPWTFKPTFKTPSVVIRIKEPVMPYTVKPPEVSIKGCIPLTDVEKVYEVKLVAEKPGELDVIIKDEGVSEGSRASQSQYIVLREVPLDEWGSFVNGKTEYEQ
jgi:hypothetical protein